MPFQPVTHVPKHGPELYFVAVLIDWVDDCDSATLFGFSAVGIARSIYLPSRGIVGHPHPAASR
jgi:hypothetical protein